MPKLTAIAVFAARLKQARVALGVSQAVLGVRMGLPPEVASTRLNRYERGIHVLDLETAEKLAKELRVPLPYLLAQDERMASLIIGFAALPVSEQDKILAAVQSAGMVKEKKQAVAQKKRLDRDTPAPSKRPVRKKSVG